jgi:two-component system sensor histidine kinase/response regulator
MEYLNEPKKIWLLLNNYSVSQTGLKLSLESRGYQIGQASSEKERSMPVQSGSELVREIEKFKPQLVVLNIDQSDWPGFELCRLVKANPHLAGSRIILFGTDPDRTNILKAYQMGASYYVAVPAEDYSLLLNLIDRLLVKAFSF